MQHYPKNIEAERALRRRPRGAPPLREIEQHREDDEPEGTADWLAHIAAGRITVR